MRSLICIVILTVIFLLLVGRIVRIRGRRRLFRGNHFETGTFFHARHVTHTLSNECPRNLCPASLFWCHRLIVFALLFQIRECILNFGLYCLKSTILVYTVKNIAHTFCLASCNSFAFRLLFLISKLEFAPFLLSLRFVRFRGRKRHKMIFLFGLFTLIGIFFFNFIVTLTFCPFKESLLEPAFCILFVGPCIFLCLEINH
mmetsp:Transcript_16939/g.29114  ORF Transcript_16939/g.29114 Transcript_16939/m.29114 type:complete len:201 (-) Transcript_16939:1814-2416(-)